MITTLRLKPQVHSTRRCPPSCGGSSCRNICEEGIVGFKGQMVRSPYLTVLAGCDYATKGVEGPSVSTGSTERATATATPIIRTATIAQAQVLTQLRPRIHYKGEGGDKYVHRVDDWRLEEVGLGRGGSRCDKRHDAPLDAPEFPISSQTALSYFINHYGTLHTTATRRWSGNGTASRPNVDRPDRVSVAGSILFLAYPAKALRIWESSQFSQGVGTTSDDCDTRG
ncbi:hypothetical protein FA13DRAFT_1711838 [Coprinellus micaceus]|uniref:Uncharacterized protein n=1 Tax=Coprinellus micaceus TaxID=71717 RepID=A0A4Y7T3L4_COPMI|nr:hypothetical protein FA13DRAFT_1711838 [Coprinellus micaceus]